MEQMPELKQIAPPGTLIFVPAGSHAYGLNTPDSDIDYRGCFMEPAVKFLGLHPIRATIERKNPDVVMHEVGKFCRLALKGNPAVLEVLWTERGYCPHPWGEMLVAAREQFLSRKSLAPFIGYARSQLYRIDHVQKPRTGVRGLDTKYASHLIRILLSGLHLATTGNVMVHAGLYQSLLMDIRNDKYTMAQVKDMADEYFDKLYNLSVSPNLPERANVKVINDLLIEIRMSTLGWTETELDSGFEGYTARMRSDGDGTHKIPSTVQLDSRPEMPYDPNLQASIISAECLEDMERAIKENPNWPFDKV